jgi:hypothetical protein
MASGIFFRYQQGDSMEDLSCPFGRRALVKFFRDGLIGLHIGSGLRTRRKA